MTNPNALIHLEMQESYFHSNNEIPFYAKNYDNPNTQVEQIQNCSDFEETSEKWKNNVLVDKCKDSSRAPFALKHLTSFEENSFDGFGNRLSESLNVFIKGTTNEKNITILTENHPRLSRMKWEEDVEQMITANEKLNTFEKEILVFSGRTNFQAELLISEIIQFIHPNCQTFSFSLAAFMISHYKDSGVQGLEEEEILCYVQENHKKLAHSIYPRLAELQLKGYCEKEGQMYENLIKIWMGIFFLSLNGFLENSHELKNSENLKQSCFENLNN